MPNLPAMPATPVDLNATRIVVALPQTTGGRGEARGWRRALQTLVGVLSNRTFAIRTDHSLQMGPPPVSIRRTFSVLTGGSIDGKGTTTFPAFGNAAYIPHNPTLVSRANAIPYRGIDDAVTIPATYAGNPL